MSASSHPSALSHPPPAPAGTSSAARTCAHCSPPVEFEKVGQRKMHYRTHHQAQTTITSPDNMVQIKCFRQPDGLFHCPRGSCPFTTTDPTSLSGHSSSSCQHAWPSVDSSASSSTAGGEPEDDGKKQWFTVSSTASAMSAAAAAAAVASSGGGTPFTAPLPPSLVGPSTHAPPLFPPPASLPPTASASGQAPTPTATTAGAPAVVRPKRYFCRRCFPHLHFTSELDKKAHIDAFHDGRARDRVIAPSGGGGSSAGGGSPTGEGKRKERADGEGGEEGGGSERKKSRSSAGGVKAESSSMRGTPTHAGHIPASLGHSAPIQAQDLLTQQQGQGQYVPVVPPFWMGQPYPPVGMPYGYPYPPPPQQQGSISPYPPSSMPPPPPPPSMHPHRTSSSMLAPPPPPAHQQGRRKSRAGGPTHQQDESPPSEVRELKPFACAFCISDPRVDFSTQGELEEHVRTSHDWRVVERARLVGREQEEQDSPEGEEKDKAGEEGAGKGDGWCAFCVPGVNMGGGLKWHVMVAHQRLKGPPTETFKIAQDPSPESNSTSAPAAEVTSSTSTETVPASTVTELPTAPPSSLPESVTASSAAAAPSTPAKVDLHPPLGVPPPSKSPNVMHHLLNPTVEDRLPLSLAPPKEGPLENGLGAMEEGTVGVEVKSRVGVQV